MRVLIIGGSGFIGTHVTNQLLALGHKVTNFHRGPTTGKNDPRIEHIFGDRTELKSFRSVFEAAKPDVVIDMIAMTEHDAEQLMSVCQNLVAKVVVISSADVYRRYELIRGVTKAPPESGVLTEGSPLREHLFTRRNDSMDASNPFYNYEKILVERAVLARDSKAVILRLPCVYGPGDGQNRLYYYLKRMDDRRKAILLEQDQLRWRWTRGYVENVAAAICCVAGDQTGIGGIYNVGETQALPEIEWIRMIGDIVGWTGRVIGADPAGMPNNLRSGLHWEHLLETDTTLLRRNFRFEEIVSFQTGLSRTIDWERANPPAISDFDYEVEDRVLALLAGN